MLVTMYFETDNLDVKDIFVYKGRKCFTIARTISSFLNSIHSGRFTPVRIIYKRETPYKGTEFHVVDFTGRSFVLIDNSGEVCKNVEGLRDWIDDLDDAIPTMTTEKSPYAYVITPENIVKRELTEREAYFHDYIRTHVSSYFALPTMN